MKNGKQSIHMSLLWDSHLNDQHTCQLLLLCTKKRSTKKAWCFVTGSPGLFLFLRSIAVSCRVIVAVTRHILSTPSSCLPCILSPLPSFFFIILKVGEVLYKKTTTHQTKEVYSCKCNDLNPFSEHCKWRVCPAVLCENLYFSVPPHVLWFRMASCPTRYFCGKQNKRTWYDSWAILA